MNFHEVKLLFTSLEVAFVNLNNQIFFVDPSVYKNNN